MRYAHVVNGIVKNVAVWDDTPPSDQFTACPEEVSPGWGYVNTAWISPEPEPLDEPIRDPEVAAALREVKDKAAKKLGLTLGEKDLLFGPNGDPIPPLP